MDSRSTPKLWVQVMLALAVPASVFLFMIWVGVDDRIFLSAYTIPGPDGQRLAVLGRARLSGRGGSSSNVTLWVFDLENPRLVASSRVSAGKDARPETPQGRYLWVGLEHRSTEYHRVYDYKAFDIYTGALTAHVDAIACSLSRDQSLGQHRVIGLKRGAVKVEFQTGKSIYVAPDGQVHAERPTLKADTLAKLVRGSPSRRMVKSLFRAGVLPNRCGCETPPSCGTLAVHRSTAFGDGESFIALVQDDQKVWDRSFTELGLAADAKIKASRSHADACLLVAWSGRGKHLLWLNRSNGQVSAALKF